MRIAVRRRNVQAAYRRCARDRRRISVKHLSCARPALKRAVVEPCDLNGERCDEIVVEAGVVILDHVERRCTGFADDAIDGAIVGAPEVQFPGFVFAKRRDRKTARQLRSRRPRAARIACSAPYRSAAEIAVHITARQRRHPRSAVNVAADDRASECMRVFDDGRRER